MATKSSLNTVLFPRALAEITAQGSIVDDFEDIGEGIDATTDVLDVCIHLVANIAGESVAEAVQVAKLAI